MRTTLFLLITLLSFAHCVVAQPEVSLSEPFEPYKWGWEKVLQLKNGNTFYFHYSKGEMVLAIYDKAHHLTSRKDIDGKDWKAKKRLSMAMNSLYEINGEAVLFVTQELEGTTLFRIRFNGETGEIVEEKVLHNMFGSAAGAGYALGFGSVDAKTYYVEKDPYSDNYAVICYNSFAKESSEQLRLLQYSGDHTETGNIFYAVPGKFKFVKPIALLVNGTNSFLAAYGYNTEKANKDSRVIISRLRKGETEFSHELIDFTDDFKKTKGIMRYNPGTEKIQLLTSTFVEKVRNTDKAKKDLRDVSYFVTLMTYIDPNTLSVVSSKPPGHDKLLDYCKKTFSWDYTIGLPQTMYVNPDHSTTIITEELAESGNLNYTGNIGISDYDKDGEETFGMAIAKKQSCFCRLSGYEKNARMKGTWKHVNTGMMVGFQDESFTSFEYIRTENNKYILFNEDDKNFDKKANEQHDQTYFVTVANTVIHSIGKDREKYSPFGRPQAERDYETSIVQSSHYLPETRTNAMVMVERHGKEIQARIAWITFK